MNTRQKGRFFVLKIIKILKRELDPATYEVSGSGASLDKGDIRIPILDLVVEAKDHKKISLAKWVRQSEREGLGHSKTAVIWKMPDSPSANPDIRVDIPLDYFIDLANGYKDPKIENPDRETAWLIKSAITILKKLLKRLDRTN